MKSAWEIAMEKTERLGKASPEELQHQKEEKYHQIAQSLAEKLRITLDLRQWDIDLKKHPVEDRELLKQKVLSFLVEALDLQKEEESRKALTALRYFRKDAPSQETEDQIAVLLDEYEQVKHTIRQELIEGEKAALQKRGISGTALGEINPLSTSKGQQRLQERTQPFNEKLNNLKRLLLTN